VALSENDRVRFECPEPSLLFISNLDGSKYLAESAVI